MANCLFSDFIFGTFPASLANEIIVHGSSIAVFTLGKHLNTLSFTITYTQDNATTQASAHSSAGWASRLPRFQIASRNLATKKGKIGPISAPRDGRPLNSDTMREGGPISLSAIGRQDVTVETAPEAARRREARRHDIENVRGEGDYDEALDDNEETFEEKINEGEEAWREGDNIIIEDESGEVIRTITSPEQHRTDAAGEKFGHGAMEKISRLESKAEEEVGGITGRLKRMWSGSSRQEPIEREQRARDLEKGIPEDEDDKVITRKSSSTTDSPKRSPPRASSGPSFVVDDANRRTGHVSDSIQRRAREEREEETEVERRRREAVLGAQQDDEYRPAVSRNKGKQPESSSDEDDDNDEEPIPSSQSQSSSGRAESSGSGNQLLSPPLRARGIRFGEINVGQESFTLEEGPPSVGARHHKTGSGGDWRVRWSNK